MTGKQGAIRYHRTLSCECCGKWSYRSRKAARRAARTLHPDDPGLQAYRCPHGDAWHYGHWRYGPPGSAGDRMSSSDEMKRVAAAEGSDPHASDRRGGAMTDSTAHTMGQLISDALHDDKIKQRDFAVMVGTSEKHLSRVVTCTATSHPDTLDRWASALRRRFVVALVAVESHQRIDGETATLRDELREVLDGPELTDSDLVAEVRHGVRASQLLHQIRDLAGEVDDWPPEYCPQPPVRDVRRQAATGHGVPGLRRDGRAPRGR